jgi:flagellar hook assembly protein FlgD
MAQFSSLEQMQNINQNLEKGLLTINLLSESLMQGADLGYAVSLIGMGIEYQVGEELKTGKVTAIRASMGGVPKLLVGEDEIALETITKVWSVKEEEGGPNNESSDSTSGSDITESVESGDIEG